MKTQLRHHFVLTVVAAICLCHLPIEAQQAPDDAIAPFVDDQTLVVVRIDAGRVNPLGMVDWMTGRLAAQKVEQPGIDLVRKNWQARAERSSLLLTGLRNANTPHLYWILSIADITGVASVSEFWESSAGKGVWVVPLRAGADSAAILKLIASDRARNGKPFLESKQIGNAAVAAMPGHVPPGAHQPLPAGWAQALGGDAPIQIGLMPGTTLRRAYEENLPTVFIAGGPVPITTFTRGLQWLSVSMAQPPAAKLSAVFQATDPAAANAAGEALRQALAGLHGQKIQLPWWWFPPIENVDSLIDFRVDGSQLKWTPDVPGVIEPLVAREIAASVGLLASSNMKQILLGSIMYANTHKEFPPDVSSMMKEQEMSPGVLKDPLHPRDSDGYEYIKPANWQKDAATTPVIYEKWTEGRLVGFADGHVEVLKSRAAVEKLVRGRKAAK